MSVSPEKGLLIIQLEEVKADIDALCDVTNPENIDEESLRILVDELGKIASRFLD